jgi:hypothetical protein
VRLTRSSQKKAKALETALCVQSRRFVQCNAHAPLSIAVSQVSINMDGFQVFPSGFSIWNYTIRWIVTPYVTEQANAQPDHKEYYDFVPTT